MQGSATSKPPRCRQARDASRHTPSRPRKCQRRARRDGPRKGRVGGTPSMSTSISNQSRSCRSRPSRLVAAAGSAGRCSCYAARICRGCSASAGEAGGGAVGRRAMHDRRRRAAEQWIRGGTCYFNEGVIMSGYLRGTEGMSGLTDNLTSRIVSESLGHRTGAM